MSPSASAAAQGTPDALLRHLEWSVLRRLDGLLQGDYRTLWRGTGLDLADLREYQFGDDVRHIDWNVTARLQVPHVRQYTEDRELSAWFLLDLSGSVDFGSGDTTKLALSEGFVAVLARLLTRHGNRVGALLYGHAPPPRTDSATRPPDTPKARTRGGPPAAPAALEVVPPRMGRTQVLTLLSRMRARAPKAQAGQETRLADLLQAAEALMRRRAMVFVVSDFISTPGWAEALGRLARRHEVVAVRLYDALELALPDVGLVTLEDAESGEQLLVDTQDAGFRERFEALAARHEADLRSALARAGVDTLELATDDDLLAALLRFVALRRQRLRAPLPGRLPSALRRSIEPLSQDRRTAS